MKIALGTDHAGFPYKQVIKDHLVSLGIEVEDFGCHSEDPVDYPDFVVPAAEAVARGDCDGGIVFGGSGNGEAMAANKVSGVRCGLVWDLVSARLTKQHNNANVIAIGRRMVSIENALEMVRTWMESEFEGGRHQRRIEKLDRML